MHIIVIVSDCNKPLKYFRYNYRFSPYNNKNNYNTVVVYTTRHPDPRSRPLFGQITKLLAGNVNYLLGWSDEDKQVAGEGGMKLGAPLECSKSLYPDLRCTYS